MRKAACRDRQSTSCPGWTLWLLATTPPALRFHWSAVARKVDPWRLLTAVDKSVQERWGAKHPRVQAPSPDVTLQQHTGKEEKSQVSVQVAMSASEQHCPDTE